MAKSFLVEPDTVERRLRQRYNNSHKKWLSGEGSWPLELPLGIPTEHQARENLNQVKVWQQHWLDWQGVGDIQWAERRWPGLGTQNLPERILINNPLQVAQWINEEQRWQTANQRYTQLTQQWPVLQQILLKYYNVLADYEKIDYLRLFAVLKWFESNPESNLFIRQIPVEGIHSKWLLNRKAVLTEMLKIIRQLNDASDFYDITGLRREPSLIRFKLLDSKLRKRLGNLSDIAAPIEQIKKMQLPLKKVYIVENQQTGMAFEDIDDAMVFMGLGYAVEILKQIRWLNELPIYYWGDIDADGFAILNRIRSHFPQIKSILMDETTLLRHKNFWSEDEKGITEIALPMLTEKEQSLYKGLCNNRWGTRLRLEQERIAWDYAWDKI